ncbi:MAG: hypothetical protein V1650_02740 [Candidatus Omnitrophota bacterium]
MVLKFDGKMGYIVKELEKMMEFLREGVFIFMPKNAPHSLSADENLAILLSLFGKS